MDGWVVGDGEWFTVEMPKPLAFLADEQGWALAESRAVLRLPCNHIHV